MDVAIIFIIWIILLFLGVPVGFSLLIAGLLYFMIGDWSLVYSSGAQLIAGIDNFTLLAIPFFILTGALMNSSGITDRIFDFARSLVGHITGGIGHVNITASLMFSGMSGSSLADAGGLGQLEIKTMRKAGYDDDYNGGLTAASAILSGIIPPSLNMIIYAAIANVSVASMFIAGLVPGLLVCVSLFAAAYILAKKRGYQVLEKASLKMIGKDFLRAFWALLTPVIIIVGIFSGYFTPTEAAVVSTCYALILGFFVYRELNFQKLYANIVDSMKLTGVVVLMLASVEFFGQFIAREQVAIQVADFFLGVTENPILLLLLISVLLLILGTFIEALALLVLVVPVLIPVATSVGIDPIFFGIFVILCLMIGILTPPMGMALFVVSRVGDIPVGTMYRGVLPFLLPLFAVLIILIFVPEIATFLVDILN
ncbi:tripartite ATP-independent transporter DctM subunit [Geomicrobium halophilum]|uniref:Tripartite ATP-independent transporter DctM subunit n=1 Tax=Geomicrobium halophilum TaxID=549000 RepID=A0A841Q0S6_9BACL|nr:TRAP transporter large permease [Geomicrobium halophilum]MBB6450975.1 tripartite ATP-independent transporter DctM subunit [Geomicrobium halophilum]